MPTPLVIAWAPYLTLAEETGSSPFAGTIYQSIAAVLVFLALMVVLQRYAWSPILKGLQGREAKIKTDLEKAEQAAREAAATLKKYEQQLAEARLQAQKILDQARLQAERQAHQIEADTQKELAQARQRFQAELQFAREQALIDLHRQTATLACLVAGQVLRREINPGDHQRLVEDAVSALKKEDLN